MQVKRFILSLPILLLFSLSIVASCLYYDKLYIMYLKAFNQSEMIKPLNSAGKIEGEVLEYKDGRIILREYFINGLREGWRTEYYANGRIKKKTLCKNDRADGKEYTYFANGKIKYSGEYRSGIPYGSVFWYYENGKLLSYTLYDITGLKSCKFDYNLKDSVPKMNGFVVSRNLYSIDVKTDSVILIGQEVNEKTYTNARDLYITVASPPKCVLKLTVFVNNKKYENLPIKDNTIKIPEVFVLKKQYEIFIQSALLDASKKQINGINIKASFKKK